MVDEAKQLISEIKQIRTQYVAEVGKGRRAWPRSIKERAARLDTMGLPAKVVAEQSGIPYETLISWRFNRRKRSRPESKGSFHEIAVATKQLPAPVAAENISKSVTVTVPKSEMAESGDNQRSNLRLTTPQGFVVDGFEDEASLSRFLRSLIAPDGGAVHAL